MTGAEMIAAERQRQVENKGFDAAHDDEHGDGEILDAAQTIVAFVAPAVSTDDFGVIAHTSQRVSEPRAQAIRLLTVAGALLAAEIDRLQRIAQYEADEATHRELARGRMNE